MSRLPAEPRPDPAPEAATDPEATAEIEPPLPEPAASRSRRRWWAPVASTVLLIGALAASWFALPIRTVEVSGQAHLSAQDVRERAGLNPGFGWLYYGAWRARGLLDDPWIRSALVTRHFPDTVTVEVHERRPVARWQKGTGTVVGLAADGTVLTTTPQRMAELASLPLIQGWGPARLAESLKVLSALGRYNVQSVAYTPTGLQAKWPTGSVWSGDLKSLLKYAGSIGMYPKQNLYIYPWGVSVQE